MKITMLIGIAGSGKSTWAKNNNANAVIVSTDNIREFLWGDASVQDNPEQVFNYAYKEVRKAISNGFDVIFDATNLTKKIRRLALSQFPKEVEIEAVYIKTPIDLAKERNSKRTRVVPQEVIEKMFNKLEPPSLDEGFNKIIVIEA